MSVRIIVGLISTGFLAAVLARAADPPAAGKDTGKSSLTPPATKPADKAKTADKDAAKTAIKPEAKVESKPQGKTDGKP
jgi:hypothetical protein